MSLTKKGRLILVILTLLGLILAAGLKFWIVSGGYVPFNADEAIVALMARHILQGERPIFFYGQSYMGSLDAYLIAIGFAIFGEHVWVIRLVQSLLYLGVLLTTAWLGKKVFSSWRVGVIALILLAVPTVNVTLYTTASLGGYGEALLIGNLILILGISILSSLRATGKAGRWRQWFLLGFLIGLGLWAFGITLIYSIPVLFLLLYFSWNAFLGQETAQKNNLKQRKNAETNLFGFIQLGVFRSKRIFSSFFTLLLGAIIGAIPWWFYAVQYGIEGLIAELGGSAIAGVEQMPWIFRIFQHLSNLLLLGSSVMIGARPPWDVFWLGLPILPFVLFFWMAVFLSVIYTFKHKDDRNVNIALLLGVILVLFAAFIFTPFGADPSGRYFVPIAIPMSLFAAYFIERLKNNTNLWAYGLIVLLLFFHLYGTIQCIKRFPPGITTQFYAPTQIDHSFDEALINFLYQHGETRGYTNYWVAYPIAFLSNEELIFTPRLPYHQDFRYTTRDDRYAPYRDQVEEAQKIAYITTNHPELNIYLRDAFTNLDIYFQQNQIGDYFVFYDLSHPIHPEEIGLGETTKP